MAFDRLPALPLIANDPYFSIWLPADLPTDANTIHWAGAQKWIRGHLTVDGRRYRYLGKNGVPAVQTTGVKVTPTQTIFEMTAGPVDLKVTFWTPALPDESTMAFSRWVTESGVVKAVLAGHLHEPMENMLPGGIPQLIAGGGYMGCMREIFFQ